MAVSRPTQRFADCLQLQFTQTVAAAAPRLVILVYYSSFVLGNHGGAQTSKEAIAPNKRSKKQRRPVFSQTVSMLMLPIHNRPVDQIAV